MLHGLRAPLETTSSFMQEFAQATIVAVLAWSPAMELTAVLTTAEEGGFVALNPETGTTNQGETVEEAVANLRQATMLYLSCARLNGSVFGRCARAGARSS